MPYGLKRGMGDILNPTAGTALDCGFFAGGVFKKECWCLDHPTWCSQSDYIAARALADPSVYDTLKEPPVVGAPSGTALTVPPVNGDQANATIDVIIAEQNQAWKDQNAASMAQTQANLDQFGQDYQNLTSGTNWLLYGVLAAVGLVALVSVGGGSPRRYGR